MAQKQFFVAIALVLFLGSAFAISDISLDFSQINNDVCLNGYEHTFEIKVKNNFSTAQQVSLSSETDQFFAEFFSQNFSLDANQERAVEMKIRFNDFFEEGNYSIPVIATTSGGQVFLANFDFGLFECTDNRSFEFSVGRTNISIDKFEKIRIPITVSNERNGQQGIFLGAESDLATRLGQSSFTLGPLENGQSFIEIETRLDDSDGLHYVDVFAWGEFGKKKETIVVKVNPNHDIRAVLLNNSEETQSCSATELAVFQVEVSNLGDKTDTVQLSIRNSDSSITIHISEPEFELERGEKKVVQVVVSPSVDAEFGEQQAILKIRGKNFDFTEELLLNFIVVEPKSPLPKLPLKILSAPTIVNANAGEKKIINVKIQNASQFEATAITVRVRGTNNSQFAISEKFIPLIAPNDWASVDLEIDAKTAATAKTYNLTIEAVSDNSFAAWPFALNISQKQKQAQSGDQGIIPAIAGLFFFMGGNNGGLGLLIIILIVAVGIIILFSLNSSKNNQIWVNYEYKV